MLTAVLVCAVVWCMFCGQFPAVWLAAACAASGAGLLWAGSHGHGPFLSIDVFAQYSRLNTVNPSLKLAVDISRAVGAGIEEIFIFE